MEFGAIAISLLILFGGFFLDFRKKNNELWDAARKKYLKDVYSAVSHGSGHYAIVYQETDGVWHYRFYKTSVEAHEKMQKVREHYQLISVDSFQGITGIGGEMPHAALIRQKSRSHSS